MKHISCLAMLMLVILGVGRIATAANPFFLKNGDRVCFYGYSITAQRYYTTDVETYVLTHYPKLKVKFVNSGIGGDRVTGGWAGPIDLRLKRDVFPFKPNVIVYLLGQNDAGYKPYSKRTFDIYRRGLKHILDSLRSHLPNVRIVLINSSPWDDITHPPGFMLDPKAKGSYNDVLIRYGQYNQQLAKRDHFFGVDFNAPLVAVLKKAVKINLKLARMIIPGRIHPSAAGHLVMAQTLLKAWGAPSTITSVRINAEDKQVVKSANTAVSGVADAHGTLSWRQMDGSLPMPIMSLHDKWPLFAPQGLWPARTPNFKYTNPVTALVVKECGFYHALDRETLRVTHLSAPKYQLRIDGQPVGTFSSMDLAHGINLARFATPMMTQAYRVLALAWQRTEVRFAGWQQVQLPMANIFHRPTFFHAPRGPIFPVDTQSNPAARMAVQKIMRGFSALEHVVAAAERQAAQPVMHHYTLVPMGG